MALKKEIVTQKPKKKKFEYLKKNKTKPKGKRRKRKNVDQQWNKSGERKTTTLWDGRRPL